ncbi:ribonuclease H-like protein, partial [Marasmius fiardii PR-910]
GNVGAAAVLYERGAIVRSIRYQLGADSHYSSYDAEVVGIILGIHLVHRVYPSTQRVTINLDGKSAIQALAQRSPMAGQYLLEAIHSMTAHRLCPKITFRWIPGHEGIEGNEEADARAKRAADGDSSNPNKLPELLRTPLPCSL